MVEKKITVNAFTEANHTYINSKFKSFFFKRFTQKKKLLGLIKNSSNSVNLCVKIKIIKFCQILDYHKYITVYTEIHRGKSDLMSL